MIARRTLPLAALLLASASHPTTTSAAESGKRVAVLEFRAGVTIQVDAAQQIADYLGHAAALDVVDPLEARQSLATVDADLARCAGDVACTARIGSALKVDEVLLVGVSQLGDVVLAIQRIEVARARVASQLSAVVPSDDPQVSTDQVAGWLKQLFSADVFKRYGYISVKANIEGAKVTINGYDKGETPLEAKIRVAAPKQCLLELSKVGRVPFSARIDVLPDSTVEVNANLPAVAQPSWYKHWYVWAIVGGLAVGAAAGTAVYMTRPDDMHSRGNIVLMP